MSDDLLAESKELFEEFATADRDNRAMAEEDILFIEDDDAQWPAEILEQRAMEHLPSLTINRLKPIVRQVINQIRENKPSIKVSPADDNADPETAEVIAGLIRNIEYTSNAEAAYDTAAEHAIKGGRGFLRVNIDYAFDDSFDLDLRIERIANPFSVYPDIYSTAADSSDWNDCFVTEQMRKEDYERRFGKDGGPSWDLAEWSTQSGVWLDDDQVLVCERWRREEVDKEIIQLANGLVVDIDRFEEDPDFEDLRRLFGLGLLPIRNRRMVKSHKVSQIIMSGAEVLDQVDWPGRYIPIISVYGDEYWARGRRHNRGLIHHAKDPQRMLNYWASQATALVALAPRSPWLIPEGAEAADPEAWDTANTRNHPYLIYGPTTDGQWVAPQRLPLDGGVAAGALQQAAQAAEDIHHVTGIYNNSLGNSGNEVSGVAIGKRVMQGDKGTFHFVDNVSRAIRHTGRVLVDLIPHVYTGERVVRVMGRNGESENVPLNQPRPKLDPRTGRPMMTPVQGPDGQSYQQAVMAMHDLSVGKYDVAVDTGPSYTTQRQEAVANLTEWVRAAPQSAPLLLDVIAKNQDWPGADEIAKRFEAMLPPQIKGAPDQQTQQLQQQLQQGAEYVKVLQDEINRLKLQLKDKTVENEIKQRGADIDAYEAVTNRLEAATAHGQASHDLALNQARMNMMNAAQYRPVVPPAPVPMSRPPAPGPLTPLQRTAPPQDPLPPA